MTALWWLSFCDASCLRGASSVAGNLASALGHSKGLRDRNFLAGCLEEWGGDEFSPASSSL